MNYTNKGSMNNSFTLYGGTESNTATSADQTSSQA
jgi:hypothetical protein